MAWTPELAPQRVRLVAVGDGGWHVVDGLRSDKLLSSGGGSEVRTVVLGTNVASLEAAAADRRIHVDRPNRGRPGSVRDELKWREDLDNELYRADLTLAIVDASDAEALEIAATACRIARDGGSLSLGFVVSRASNGDEAGAQSAPGDHIDTLVASADSAFVVPGDDPSSGDAAGLIRLSVRALLQITREPGLLKYSLREVREAFHRAGLGELATGRGVGESRFADAGRSALAAPTLFRPLHEATCVTAHIRMNASDGIHDLSTLGETVAAACAPNANFWLSVYLDSPEDDSVEVTLIAAGFSQS